MVIAMSDFFVEYWFLIFEQFSAAPGLSFIPGTLGSDADRARPSLLRIPVFGPLIRKAVMARWTRTLSTMFAAGVPLVESLDSVGGAAGNYGLQNRYPPDPERSQHRHQPDQRDAEQQSFPKVCNRLVDGHRGFRRAVPAPADRKILEDLCAIFQEKGDWYEAAQDMTKKWEHTIRKGALQELSDLFWELLERFSSGTVCFVGLLFGLVVSRACTKVNDKRRQILKKIFNVCFIFVFDVTFFNRYKFYPFLICSCCISMRVWICCV